MEKSKLITMIENGKQIGVRKLIDCEDGAHCYVYAVQKVNGKYIVYSDDVNLDTYYASEFEDDTEIISIYNCIEDFILNFNTKYGVVFEDFNVSKGRKFFNANLYG